MEKIFNFGDKPITVQVPMQKLILRQPNQEIIVWCDSMEIESRESTIFAMCYENNKCVTTFSFDEQPGANFGYKHLSYEVEKYHLWVYPVTK